MTFLKVQMNADLLTDDLKKKRASNESFWLIGQPDVEVRTIGKGEHKGKLQVEVHGFDYYNTKTGQIESGDTRRIAMWMLDPDYDGRSLFPRQVFFPMADEGDGWARLARNLKAEIDQERDRGLSRHGVAALRGGRPQARRRQDRGRPRHREPQDHRGVMSRARIEIPPGAHRRALSAAPHSLAGLVRVRPPRDFRPESDIDVLVEFEPEQQYTYFTLAQIEDDSFEPAAGSKG